MSVNSTNPSTLFGGTWVAISRQIFDRSSVRILTVIRKHGRLLMVKLGGEYYHTLTLNEMPSHRHRGLSWWGNDAKESITLNKGSGAGYNLTYSGGNLTDQQTAIETRDAGSNWKHNNMPPYLGVYMWKRTA